MGTEQQIAQYRWSIAAAIESGGDASSAAADLLNYNNASPSAKYQVIDFCSLLGNNSQSPNNLKKLLNALNILEKYGRHLLKPAESRSNMWRHIKYSNSIFRDRVDVIKGGREIMSLMGYTLNKQDGVAFPDGAEPDHARVINLVTDIFYGRKELEAYLEKQHPNPAAVEEYISPELRKILHDEAMRTSSTAGSQPTTSSPYPPTSVSSMSRQPVPGSSLPRNTPSSSIAQGVSSGNYQPMSRLGSLAAAYPQNSAFHQMVSSSGYTQNPQNTNVVSSFSPESFQPRVVTGQSMSQGQDIKQSIPSTRDSNIAQASSPAQESDPRTSGVVCDICGDNDADVICEICDNKQLCKGCDTKWHNHPKRQNHKLTQLHSGVNIPSQSAQGGQAHQQAVGIKQEQHFDQQNERFNQGQFPPLNERIQGPQLQQQKEMNTGGQQYQQNEMMNQGIDRDETHLVTMYMEQTSPRSDVRYNLPAAQLNQHMTMPSGNSGSPVSDRNRPHFQYGPVRQAPMGMPTSGMSEPMGAPMTSGFMYSQPNMMGHIPNMIPYHSGMMQTGQPMTYGVISGPVHQQYPASYQPYMTAPNQYQLPMQHANERMQRSDEMSANPAGTILRSSSSRSSIADSTSNRQSLTSPNVDDVTRETSNFPSTSQSDSVSQLLPTIKLIPDLEKRQARLEIHLMTLNDDLKDWENKINEIILQNPNFFQDVEYKMLSRKKRKHLQELVVLQNYQKVLENEIAKNAEESHREKEEYERALEVEALRKRSHLLRSNANDTMLHPAANVALPGPTVSSQQTEKDHSNRSSTSSSGLVPIGPVTTTYRRPEQYKNQFGVNPSQSADDVGCPPLQLNSLGDDDGLSADIKRMLVLDQNPYDYKPKLSTEDFKLSGLARSTHEDVAFPPDIASTVGQNQNTPGKNIGVKKEKSEPDFQGGINHPQNSIKKSQSASALPKWQCSHCTYLNDADTKACSMCSKTSDNPKLISPNMPSVTEEHPANEACEICTYENMPGSKVCEMCGHTQSRYVVLEADIIRDTVAETDPDINAACEPAQGASVKSDRQDSSGARNLIEMEQDQVYLEKKAAREKFNQMNTPGGEPIAQVVPSLKPDTRDTGLTAAGLDDSKFGIRESKSPLQASPPKIADKKSPTNKNVERVRQVSGNDQSGSSSSYNSAASSLGDEPKDQSKVKVGEQGQTKGQKHPSSLNFVEAIEQINLKREQEQMILDGHSFMAELKEAERCGFEISEVEIALRHGMEHKTSPLEWLRKNWHDNIDVVVTMATENGKAAEQNDVGEMSQQEAKLALIECNGNLDQAVELCVNNRKRKYAEISEGCQYPREEILTALYQRCGNVEEAIDQLNHAVVQRFNDRLWESVGNGGGDVAIAEAARMADLGNSVSNSIISHEDFKRVISDTNLDKERRVRMVFIEAKLRSWGRAETVITILDQEVTLSEAPLECDIEDIIEAVRNCGDRKSSLVYLRQECINCYSLYPMSKIRNLGVCDCKLCTECLQQYFEVAIREKFVRNWGCPYCEAPGLEDETTAAQYFEFLSLILQNLVSKEVIDLFETKLRDWHLQKDPNFRWCAHCAFGFLYDRPGVLSMECPSCNEKTCFKCKIKWEPQHEGFTCEEYERWKLDNDPEMQAKGVKLYLEENGIDCPSCKMRYSLAKGGCMHFKCPQCGYEFCSGCYMTFWHKGQCKMLKSCNRGLHCHHPRDCFYYLRDYDIAELQRLLKNSKIAYNTTVPPTQRDKTHCQVMEQKEFGTQKKDEACGKETVDGMAGLCENHYKEYVVSLINKNKLDPVILMDVQKIKLLIERNEKNPPKLRPGEGEKEYRRRLIQFIQEKWPLQR